MDAFKPSIVFIDQDVRTLSSLASQFKKTHHVFTTTQPDELLALLEEHTIHVVVSAQRLETTTGLDLLRKVRLLTDVPARILLTGYADLAVIVDTIEEGEIYRYLTKPWQPDELTRTIKSATKQVLEAQLSCSHNTQDEASPAEKILVIDDCEQTYDLLRTQFSGAYEVHWASNIDKVVALIEQEVFGVIISDVKLNGVNITPMIATFKSRMPAAYTVVLTRFQEAESLVRLINDGKVYRCLPKPIRASLLEMSVQRAYSLHRKAQSAQAVDVDIPLTHQENNSADRIKDYLQGISMTNAVIDRSLLN